MSAYSIANLISRHEADPTTWIREVFGPYDEITQQKADEFEQGLAMSNYSDRVETARRLRVSLNQYQIRETAYMQVYGRQADPNRVAGFQQGQQFLAQLIQSLEEC
jgi:hypothetical protein